MSQHVALYLDPALRQSAEAGEHNFIAHLMAVLDDHGFSLEIRPEGEMGKGGRVRAITHMRPPPAGGLCFRRAYHYPFWGLEPTAERWRWHVAKTAYSPELVTDPDATGFYQRWQKRLFDDLPGTADRQGFVYVPLQGRIREKRSFQSCTPIEMIRHVLAADPKRPVIAALHPKEVYSEADGISLEALERAHPRLKIVLGQMEPLLKDCDYVVTMNSAAAFNGYFFGKPAILFGEVDFHHIALRAGPDDLSAFERVMGHQPDYARYVYWFWQMNCINAGHPSVRDRISAALKRAGWVD
ncbi:hypothetical protein [Pseudooceanicola sp. MF1-13]|uniref:hypothetical protein n=1 Tax=Pseudooceanicola sp. MF1-13 TaxID=3379095 RepID=UPI003892CBDF